MADVVRLPRCREPGPLISDVEGDNFFFCIFISVFSNFVPLNFVLQATEAPSTVEGDISPEEARCVCCVDEGGGEGEREREREEEGKGGGGFMWMLDVRREGGSEWRGGRAPLKEGAR